MKLPDTTSGVPLVLARSIKIRPGSNLEVPLECTRQLTDQMDIRIDTGFHHKNPSIYIPPSCINNPNNKYNPRYMPLTIFNLSTVDHLYIGKDTMITFAEQPVLETYNIELASEDKIKEHLAKPQNWVPQRHETLPEIPHDTAFICSPVQRAFSSSYAGCSLPCLLVSALFGSHLHLLSEGCTLVWGMVVRGCARRDLC